MRAGTSAEPSGDPPVIALRHRAQTVSGRAAGAIAVVVILAVVVGLLTRPSASDGKSVSARLDDQHGFPRTLAFNKCGDLRDLARRDMVVGLAYCDVAELRRFNPSGIFFLQPGLFPDGSNDYGGMSVTYGAGLWYWREGQEWKDGGCDKLPGGISLGCIRPFDSDYDALRNADGSAALIHNGTAGHPGWNLADPLNKGTPDLVARFIAYIAKLDGLYSKGWDGIFSDNWIYGIIGKDFAYGANLDTNRDGKVDDLGVLRKRWDDGLNDVGARLRSYLPGKSVVGNGNWFGSTGYFGTDPNGWLKNANGTMIEGIGAFYYSSSSLLRTASRWLAYRGPTRLPRYLLFLQNAMTSSGRTFRIPVGADPNRPRYMLDRGVMRSMRWGFTLAAISGAYYELHVDGNHSTRWWYDEYDGGQGVRKRGYLGRRAGRVAQLRKDVWRRDFEHGIVLNNSSSKSATIDLKRRFRHLRGKQNPRLNDGSVVSRVTIPAHDGLILLDVEPGTSKKK